MIRYPMPGRVVYIRPVDYEHIQGRPAVLESIVIQAAPGMPDRRILAFTATIRYQDDGSIATVDPHLLESQYPGDPGIVIGLDDTPST